MIDIDGMEDYCAFCGGALEYEDCPDCGGEGFCEHEGDAEEPRDSLEDCDTCDGLGGWWYCPHPHEGGCTT